MIIPDVNLLLYAANRDAPLHRPAREWLEKTLSSSEPVAFAWIVVLAFLRLTTRSGLFRSPLPAEAAFGIVTDWLDQPGARIVHPGPRHLSVIRGLLAPLGTAGNLTSDAHLAALAIEQNALLCSCDQDFARFTGLRWQNPLGANRERRR